MLILVRLTFNEQGQSREEKEESEVGVSQPNCGFDPANTAFST